MDPRIRALFQNDQWTAVDWRIRQEMNRQPLAQWLHGFYSTHAQPYAMTVETLYQLCGSESKSLRSFKQELGEALKHVEDASRKHSVKFEANLEKSLVHVKKQGSRSQMRHLQKQAGKLLSTSKLIK